MLYDVQSLHYLANMKVPDAGIIIFRNIVRWTIRKQAFEFAKTAVETLCLAPDFNKDDIDATRICFVDNRRVVLSIEVGGELRGDPAFVSDARRLNKDYFVGVHNLKWSPDDDGNKTLFWEF